MSNLNNADIANQLQCLVTAMHKFACSLDIGDDRTDAFDRYEVLRRLQRCGTASEMLAATNPFIHPAIKQKDVVTLESVIEKFREHNIGFPVEHFKADYVISWVLVNYINQHISEPIKDGM